MPRRYRKNILEMSPEEITRFLTSGQSVTFLQKLKEQFSTAIQGFETVIKEAETVAVSSQPISQQEVESKLRRWADGTTTTADSLELIESIKASGIDATQLPPNILAKFKLKYLSDMQSIGEQYFDAKEKLQIAKKHLVNVDLAIAASPTFAEQKGTIYRDSPLRSPLTIATAELMALQKDDRYMHFFKHYGKDNNRALRIACTDQSMVLLDKLAKIHKLQPLDLDPNQIAGDAQKNAFHIAAERGGQAMYDKLVGFGFTDQGVLNADEKKPNDCLQAHQARAFA